MFGKVGRAFELALQRQEVPISNLASMRAVALKSRKDVRRPFSVSGAVTFGFAFCHSGTQRRKYPVAIHSARSSPLELA
jgi:hypothetical protein